ncbi:MAG: 3-oxoacyl-[acyl-carrier-protein] synthase III C-terminal domain-containing protein [Candidatus Eisenbacteria bacterium]
MQGFPIDAAGHIVPHQVSGRIGALAAAHFGLPPDRMFVQADRVGNTGSAAIWIALDTLRAEIDADDTIAVLGAEASKHMFGGFAYRPCRPRRAGRGFRRGRACRRGQDSSGGSGCGRHGSAAHRGPPAVGHAGWTPGLLARARRN